MQKFPVYGIICYNWKLIMAFANARFKYSLVLCYTCIYYTFMYIGLHSQNVKLWTWLNETTCNPQCVSFHFCHLQHKQLQQTVFPFRTIITEDLIVAIMSTINIFASIQLSNTVDDNYSDNYHDMIFRYASFFSYRVKIKHLYLPVYRSALT